MSPFTLSEELLKTRFSDNYSTKLFNKKVWGLRLASLARNHVARSSSSGGGNTLNVVLASLKRHESTSSGE